MNPIPLRVVALCGLIALTACPTKNPATNPSPPPTFGSISGTVNLALSAELSDPVDTQGIVPGRVIVRFKPRISTQGLSSLRVTGLSVGERQLEQLRPLALSGTHVYTAPNLDAAGTLELVRALEARPDVASAEPDRMLKPMSTPPNDTYFIEQWNLQAWSPQLPGALNLPAAWDISQGSPSTTVAILDTGLLYNHPDLTGRAWPGFDFISDPTTAHDGGGRDNNAEDSGDVEVPNTNEESSFHGSHVAGIIGASTNNGIGVAGINRNAKLLPVRVLGVGGGLESDILDAIIWSAGGAVVNVPVNTHPADVINLSLGIEGTCGQAFQSAIAQARAQPQQPIIVVAAGNGGGDGKGDDAALTMPANCSGVIAVGATDQHGQRTPYSNYGQTVRVMAPGGDSAQPFAGQKYGGSVLSTLGTDDGNQNGVFNDRAYEYGYSDGTSMATPHIAGLLSLMKGLRPSLTTIEALSILRDTARPLSSSDCKRPSGTDCGAGLPDAKLALERTRDGLIPDGLEITVDKPTVRLRPGQQTTVNATLNRAGNLTGPITLSVQGAPAGVTVTPTGTGDQLGLNVNVASGVEGGAYTLYLQGPTGPATPLNLLVEGVKGTEVIAIFINPDGSDNFSKSGQTTIVGGSRTGSYTINGLESGKYEVFAWQDMDRNGLVGEGDYLGRYSLDGLKATQVSPPNTSVNINLDPISAQARAMQQRFAQVFSQR